MGHPARGNLLLPACVSRFPPPMFICATPLGSVLLLKKRYVAPSLKACAIRPAPSFLTLALSMTRILFVGCLCARECVVPRASCPCLRSVDPVLLPRCMRHLLALAQPQRCDPSDIDRALGQRAARAGDWKSTVHALNVLRVVFADATLADDIGPYVTQARQKKPACFLYVFRAVSVFHCAVKPSSLSD